MTIKNTLSYVIMGLVVVLVVFNMSRGAVSTTENFTLPSAMGAANVSDAAALANLTRPLSDTYPADNLPSRYTSDEVQAGNYYTDNWNTPNFESNVMDIRNFFKAYPDTPSPSTCAGDGPSKTGASTGGDTCFGYTPQAVAAGGKPSPQPPASDVWQYKNELVMNGGQLLPAGAGVIRWGSFTTPPGMGDGAGVFGFSPEEDTYATFSAPPKRIANTLFMKEYPPDDIRGGMGQPGQFSERTK